MSQPNDNDFSKIRHVQDGDPVSAPVTSQPIRAIELRLLALEALAFGASSSITNGQLIIPNVNINVTGDNAVAVDDVVFYNASTGLFEKAVASVTLVSGVFNANPTALAIGIIVAIRGSQADVMIGGYDTWGTGVARTTKLNQMLVEGEAGFMSGIVYYLSDTTPGKLTQFPPALKVQVITAQDQYYVLTPAYSTPDSIENIYASPVGMRPVGGIRNIEPDFKNTIVVGFDGLEKYDETTNQNLWRTTLDSTVPDIQNFGYLVGDATVSTAPQDPIYIRVQVAKTTGAITVFSASKLADLTLGDGNAFNTITSFTALGSGNLTVLRSYPVVDAAGNALGTFKFKFVSSDLSLERHVILKFPDHFQGWKAVNAAVMPILTPVITAGVISRVDVDEGSIGYTTPPTIVVTGSSTTPASLTAVLNDFGSIVSVTINDGGTGYTTPTLSTISTIESVQVLNAGEGATATATATVTTGVITAVALTNAGTGYLSDPDVIVTDISGSGTGADVRALARNGVIVKLVIVSGGTGYSGSVALNIYPKVNLGYDTLTSTPRIGIAGTAPTSVPTLTPIMAPVAITRVDVLSGGSDYDNTTTIALTPAHGAILKPIIQSGVLVRVDIVNPGSGFTGAPAIVINGVSGSNNARIAVILGSYVNAVTVTAPGAGYQSGTTALVGVPLDHIEMEDGGSGYDPTAPPTVVIDLPEVNGGLTVAQGAIQATATAIMGRQIASVKITNAGSGYNNPNAATITVTDHAGHGGTGAVLVPIFSGGSLVDVEIVNPGTGYAADATAVVTGIHTTGATIQITLESSDAVVGLVITNPGHGYVTPPQITIGAPTIDPTGVVATAQAKLHGGGAALQVTLAGDGGIRLAVPNGLDGVNALQASDYPTDFPDLIRPVDMPMYYNISADPLLKARYPAIPVDKADFMLNGVELQSVSYNEVTAAASDPNTDVCLSRRTMFWTTMNENGCPWDSAFQQYVNDFNVEGDDCVIPATGPINFLASFWKIMDQVFNYETVKNNGWIHLNKASRFHQSGRVSSLSCLAPLRLIDVVTGNESANDGTPMTGQLLLVNDSEVNLLGGTLYQIDLTDSSTLQSIYQNTTGRQVAITSVLLTVSYQNNAAGLTPTVDYCAEITIGTQAGNYRDIVGVTDTNIFKTRLFAVNQFKEIFPDIDQPVPLLQPNDSIFVKVVQPANSPIVKQIAVARVKGHVF